MRPLSLHHAARIAIFKRQLSEAMETVRTTGVHIQSGPNRCRIANTTLVRLRTARLGAMMEAKLPLLHTARRSVLTGPGRTVPVSASSPPERAAGGRRSAVGGRHWRGFMQGVTVTSLTKY